MDHYRTAVITKTESSTAVNVFHHIATTGLCQEIAETFRDNIIPGWMLLLSEYAYVREIITTNIEQQVQYTLGINEQGSAAGHMLPPQCAMLVSWKTAFIGRKNRGRTYFPYVAEGLQDAGNLNVVAFDNLVGLGTDIIGNWVTTIDSESRLVVYHRETNTHNVVVTSTARPQIYQQRRRAAGVGM